MEIGTLCPTGFRLIHVSRHDSITFGGGIGFLFKESLIVNTRISENFETFSQWTFA